MKTKILIKIIWLVALFSFVLFGAHSLVGKDKNNEHLEFKDKEKKQMKKYVIHKADTRGFANHGWLQAKHTFSFAGYYDPERVQFGVLRVLNDDIVSGGRGFDTHPHENMEIITIPLKGALKHKDSMGNSSIISAGEIQVMSAGTGVYHSEFNALPDEPINLLQIWIYPNKKNVEPRYAEITIDTAKQRNNLLQILSPEPSDETVWIYQDAWFHKGIFDNGHSAEYSIQKTDNGIYVFVINGDFEIGGEILKSRDGIGIWDVEKIEIKSLSDDAEILVMEVPMR
jgi:quercetin 2,3-dioxygenase